MQVHIIQNKGPVYGKEAIKGLYGRDYAEKKEARRRDSRLGTNGRWSQRRGCPPNGRGG